MSDEYHCQAEGCGRAFDSERGLNIHYGQVHGKEAGSCDAPSCSEPWEKPPSRVHDHNFCSPGCVADWRSENMCAENNPSWKGGKETVVCDAPECTEAWEKKPSRAGGNNFCSPQCLSEYQSEKRTGVCDGPECTETWEKPPSGVAGNNFCSADCKHEWRSENVRGEDHHRWSRQTGMCDGPGCAETWEKPPSRVTEHNFCSHACWTAWFSENVRGEDHHLWREDAGLQYGRGWHERKRESVRDRDGRECQVCGMGEDEHLAEVGGKLHVHHITPAREFDDPEPRNAMENLTTLCQWCHNQVEGWGVVPQSASADSAVVGTE